MAAIINTPQVVLTHRQLAELIDRGQLLVVIDDVLIMLADDLRAGDRAAWHEVVLAVARRVQESSL
jgi:hypothetical protein